MTERSSSGSKHKHEHKNKQLGSRKGIREAMRIETDEVYTLADTECQTLATVTTSLRSVMLC